MADGDKIITKDRNSTSDDVVGICDPRLDFFSDKFDPLYALTATNVRVPDSTAKKYDNLAAYKTATDREKNPQLHAAKKKNEPTKDVLPERRWKEHQMPIKSTVRRRTAANLFTKMDEAKGIYAVLKKCIDEKRRVKVWTRNQKAVRGYCLAYLVAFDKFWNMVLEDVTEYWNRPKKPKVPALDTLDLNVDVRKIMSKCIRPPKIQVFPHESDKKLECCVRHVDQLMIRGEQVVFVNVVEEIMKNKPVETKVDKDNPGIEKRDDRKDEKTVITKKEMNKKSDKIGEVVEVSDEDIVEISDDECSKTSAGARKTVRRKRR